MVNGEKVIRKIEGVTELSSDKEAIKELNRAISELITLARSSAPGANAVEKAASKYRELSQRIDTDLAVNEIILTEWEKDVFKVVATEILNSTYAHAYLGATSREADMELDIDFPNFKLCVDLVEKRGLVANNAGDLTLTEKGRLFYRNNYL